MPRAAQHHVSKGESVIDKRTVAVCDILGFSNLVESQDLDLVVESAVGWFRRALHHSMHKNTFPHEPPELSETDSHSQLGVAWFSDTVLLYTKDDSDHALQKLLETVAWLVFETMVQGTTRVRAGIAYGDVCIDPENSIYVGRPIVEAYRLEQDQQWAGASLAKSAELRLPNAARTGQYADWWLVWHDIPLKSQGGTRMLALNWAQGIHHPEWRLLWSSKSEEPSKEDWASDKGRCEKFVNTRRFHDEHCSYCRPSSEKPNHSLQPMAYGRN